jgi:hypothetical protein
LVPVELSRARFLCVPPAAATLVLLAVDLSPTRFHCVPHAARTLVLLAVELSCVAMVTPGPSWLTV